MKKSLIALAALAATASFAQSTVSISGLIDAGYRWTDAAGTKSTGLSGSGNSATTVLTVAGSEDLGGGLKANFQLQLTPDFINGGGVAGTTVQSDGKALVSTAQQAFVGLSGGFGEVQAGRVNSNALDAWGVGSAFGTALGSGYGSAGNIYTRYSSTGTATVQSAPTRFNGAIRYISPNFNGFTGSLLVVPKAASTKSQSVTDFGLKYSNGPLNVAFASQEIKQYGAAASSFTTGIGSGATSGDPAETTDAAYVTGAPLADGTSNKLNALSANYTIGAATVYGALWTEKQNTTLATDARGQMIGVKYVIGATSLFASYGRNNDKTEANLDKKIYGLGADYALSKRTALFARYENRKTDTANVFEGTPYRGAEAKTTTTSIGVRHTF